SDLNSEDITDAEFIEVKDSPQSSAARPASTGESAEKASNAVLALGSAGVISSVSADTADSDVGGNAPALHYDTRYIPPPASTADSGTTVINHGGTAADGGQPA